ncbi:MAG: hypothetical protein SFV54_17475 [Bryobacteraceae bacterium]|nr:hypothetical protein [Bryobacteraceae bacterium]
MKRFLTTALIALTLAACSRRDPTAGFVDPALATLIPADTVMLAGVKVESVRETPLYRKYIEGSSLLKIDELSARTGFDPRKDLWNVLMTSNGKEVLVMARGKFSEMGREPKSMPNVKRSSYKGYTLLGDDETGVLFVNASTALVGTIPAMQRAVDQKDSSKGVPKPLLEQIRTLPAESQVWMAALGGRVMLPLQFQGNAANLGKIIQEMQTATLSMNLRNGVDLAAQANYTDDKLAQQTRDALRALLGIARLTTPSAETDVLKAFDTMQVNQVGTAVKFTAQMPPDLVEKLANRAAARIQQ